MNATFDDLIKSRTLDIDFKQIDSASIAFTTLCTDLFLIIMNISPDVNMGTEDDIRRILKYYVDQFLQNCNTVKINPKKSKYVQYALVALIDEKILKLPEELSTSWSSHMLQLDYFDEMVAGKRFFEHLDFLMQNPGSYWDVLEIYYLCLCLGFKGMHLHKPEELQNLISKLPKMIVASRPELVKPAVSYAKKDSRIHSVVPHIPTWAIASIAAVTVLVVWLGIVFVTGNLTRKHFPDPNAVENMEDRHSLKNEMMLE